MNVGYSTMVPVFFLIWISFLSVLLIHIGSRIVLTDCEAVLRFDASSDKSIILFVFIKGSRLCEISIRITQIRILVEYSGR